MQYPHENLIRIYNITRLKKRWLLFFMSLSKGNLFSWLAQKRPRGLKEEEARCIFRQLVAAIHHLHTCLGIAHRDMKLENILVHRERKGSNGHVHLDVRLGDLGFCSRGQRKEVSGGTIWYQMCQS